MGFANVARFFLCGLNFSLEDFFFLSRVRLAGRL